ncbi:MAG: hypothetical protein AMJ65_03505 [Phycisphaerae bacterium SG8_4]|nr:MAG: hypothetical protein AMJ65_03505 [Phycisphaerae bacterium SG8_4]
MPQVSQDVWTLLDEAKAALGARQADKALPLLEKAVRLWPEEGAAWNALGRALNNLRRLEEARQAFRRAVDLLPDSADAWNNLGHVCRALEDLEHAYEAFKRAVGLKPNSGRMLANLASIELILGDAETGIDYFRSASELCPTDPSMLVQLGDALQGVDRLSEAEAAYRGALNLDPRSVAALTGLASVQIKRAQYSTAEDNLKRSLEFQPDDPVAVSLLAQCLEIKGLSESVLDLLESRKWAHEPDWVAASRARQLLRLGRTVEAGESLQNVDLDSMRPRSRAAALNALARMHEDKGDYAEAFSAYAAANKARGGRFNPRDYCQTINRLISFFSKDKVRALRGLSGNQSDLPVFIVGMPRSGTSLVEQILGCHSAVQPCGERTEIFRLPRRLSGGSAADRWPECIEEVDAHCLAIVAEQYLLNAECSDRAVLRITDKLPGNFLNLGLIEVLFPRARVIYCRRDPMDTGLSCYQQDFNNEGMDFARELTHIGVYQLGCWRLMAHWQAVSGLAIHAVDYEGLVTNPDAVSRDLVSFLGLEWEDACLHYYESDRIVRTASMHQVRQPIYRSSIGRWRNYAPWLGALQEILEVGWVEGGCSTGTVGQNANNSSLEM